MSAAIVLFALSWAKGIGTTLLYAFAAFLGALMFALCLALVERSHFAGLWRICSYLTDFIVTTPLVIQLIFVFFVLPAWGIYLPAPIVGSLCFSLHYGCYMSRTLIAGLKSVVRDQRDAGLSLGLSSTLVFFLIELPQAVFPYIPQYGNYLILLLKETALLSVITIPELFGITLDLASRSFRYFELLTLLGVTYYILTRGIVFVTERAYRQLWLGASA